MDSVKRNKESIYKIECHKYQGEKTWIKEKKKLKTSFCSESIYQNMK